MNMIYVKRYIQPIIHANGYEFPRGTVADSPVLSYVASRWLWSTKNKRGVIANLKQMRSIRAVIRNHRAAASRMISLAE